MPWWTPFLMMFACLAGNPAVLAQTAPSPLVLELFTSQGCSACPAADALLKSYVERPGVIALSLSVDYWDHLGWKDTLASPKNTARQKLYAKTLGTGNVYTPQAVVNGAFQAVGSKKYEIEKAIAQATKAGPGVGLSAVSDGKRVTIEVGELAKAVSATIWIAVVAPKADVEIKRGENRGKVLTYHNVVRDISPAGMWSGAPMKVELPVSAVLQPGDRSVVLLQADEGGRILAATWTTP